MTATTLKIAGMTCQGCVASVTRILKAQPGVKDAQVSLEQAEAVLEFDPAMTDIEHLRKAIEDGGYEAV